MVAQGQHDVRKFDLVNSLSESIKYINTRHCGLDPQSYSVVVHLEYLLKGSLLFTKNECFDLLRNVNNQCA
jgi:hypothetical protein